MDSFLELCRDRRERTSTEHVGDLVEGRYLGRGLNDIQWVSMRAVADSEAVDADSVEATGNGSVDV